MGSQKPPDPDLRLQKGEVGKGDRAGRPRFCVGNPGQATGLSCGSLAQSQPARYIMVQAFFINHSQIAILLIGEHEKTFV